MSPVDVAADDMVFCVRDVDAGITAEYGLRAMLEGSPGLEAELLALEVGQTIRVGGGAAPEYEVERVA